MVLQIDAGHLGQAQQVDGQIGQLFPGSTFLSGQDHLVPLPGCREQFMAQLLPRAAAGLDRVAVGAQRDHLLWVVRAALGEILDVVHIQDRPSGIGDVLRLTRAARVLAVPFAAQ